MASDVENLLNLIRTVTIGIVNFSVDVPGGFWLGPPDDETAKPFVRVNYGGMSGNETDNTGSGALNGPVETYLITFTVVGTVPENLLTILESIEKVFVNRTHSPSDESRVLAAYKIGDELDQDPDRESGAIVWVGRLQMSFMYQRGVV